MSSKPKSAMRLLFDRKKIKKWVGEIIEIIEATNKPSINSEKILGLESSLRNLYTRKRIYNLKIGPIEAKIQTINSQLRGLIDEYTRINDEISYETNKNSRYSDRLDKILGTVICLTNPELDDLTLSASTIKRDIENSNKTLTYLIALKTAIDNEYIDIHIIGDIEKFIVEEKKKPDVYFANLKQELNRFAHLLSMIELVDQYVEYADKYNLGIDCFPLHVKIEYLQDLKSLISPQISTSDYDHEFISTVESYMWHLVSVCNKHHYYHLLETHVVSCCEYVSTVDNNMYDDSDFIKKHPNGGYKPGEKKCSHGLRYVWVQDPVYCIDGSHIKFDKTGKLEFTILDTIPPGHCKY